jgi:hypothetical protein
MAHHFLADGTENPGRGRGRGQVRRPASGGRRSSATGLVSRAVKGFLSLVKRLVHLGVDPAKPRHETKHIVLTNQLALLFVVTNGIVSFSPTLEAWPPIVREAHISATLCYAVVLLLNRAKWPTAAAAFLIASSSVQFAAIGRVEPDAAGLAVGYMLNGATAWFVFRNRLTAGVVCVLMLLAMVWLTMTLARDPPPGPQGFDMIVFGLGNRALFYVLLVLICAYAAREMARVELDLMAERARVETLLKREVSHQVAERSRELGQALARGDVPVASALPAPGDRFHTRYRVVRALGEGGMGAVFEVERLTDAQRLALKVVTGVVSGTSAARFAREAEIGARVHHANLVSIVDVGIAQAGAPFLVMELVTGGSLEDRRARFGEAAWALPILRQIADGLDALHAAAVVHRDLKPANVLLTGDGGTAIAKISDFGISRFGQLDATGSVNPEAATVDLSPSPSPPARHLTGTGALLGTPLYMAPEAARGGRTVDAPADIFAFGVLAYEAITGRPPFSVAPVLLALGGQSLPVAAPIENATIEAKVRDCILACLSEDPATRPTARRVREALSGTG